jgi:hypothetical protein
MRAAQLQDRRSLSIALLVEGRPQAFVDFFRLTHSQGGDGAAPAIGSFRRQQGAGGVTASIPPSDIPQESLVLLKQHLAQADAARKAGAVEDVYSSYKLLAKHFAQLGKLRTSEFFFRQCLHISKESGWLPGELEANLALGVVYEELKDTAAAIACHERRLELAAQHELQVCG